MLPSRFLALATAAQLDFEPSLAHSCPLLPLVLLILFLHSLGDQTRGLLCCKQALTAELYFQALSPCVVLLFSSTWSPFIPSDACRRPSALVSTSSWSFLLRIRLLLKSVVCLPDDSYINPVTPLISARTVSFICVHRACGIWGWACSLPNAECLCGR